MYKRENTFLCRWYGACSQMCEWNQRDISLDCESFFFQYFHHSSVSVFFPFHCNFFEMRRTVCVIGGFKRQEKKRPKIKRADARTSLGNKEEPGGGTHVPREESGYNSGRRSWCHTEKSDCLCSSLTVTELKRCWFLFTTWPWCDVSVLVIAKRSDSSYVNSSYLTSLSFSNLTLQ